MIQSSLLAAARGERPADVLFKGGMVANVLTSELERVDVAVTEGRVAGLGTDYEAAHVVDVSGRFLFPGYLDAHVHIESSLATPAEFARAVVPRGTTTVVCDPHEIANVHGLAGIHYMLRCSENLPLSVLVMASSCVPATHMGTAGAELTAGDLSSLLAHDRVLGLAEVMNFPGVIDGHPDVLAKIDAFRGLPVDGHAPSVRGAHLNAYVVGGPMSDHECTTPEEALEKLRRGLWLFLREATNARNLRDLLPALTAENRRRVALCTDDRQPPDLLDEGGVDHMLRVLVESGIEPVEALRLATLNPAEYFGLRDRGAIAPGRRADVVVVSDLHSFAAEDVFVGGTLVARSGEALPWSLPPPPPPPAPSMRVEWDRVDLSIPARGDRVRVIRVVPDQIVTDTGVTRPRVIDGMVAADPVRDLLKIAVIERHTGSGRVGLGIVQGMGLAEGALASTVAHDHHNIIVVGVDDRSMLSAARAVAAEGGGLAVARGDGVLATLPLPVAGLMSDRPMDRVRQGLEAVLEAARNLGSGLHDPFMALSFLGLEVIPSLKITDRGLVDVDAFQLVDLWA
jgi:adenine deaminase